MENTLTVFLSTTQWRKYKTGKSFQLTHKQLTQNIGKHEVVLELERGAYKKLQSNIKNKKGFRFAPKHLQGGSIKSIIKTVKKGADRVKDLVVNNVSKRVVKNVARTGLNKVASITGLDMIAPNIVSKAVNRVDEYIDNAYKGRKQSKKTEEEPMKAEVMGEGIMKKPRLVKGSQQAKDYMAMIRSKKGGSCKASVPSLTSKKIQLDTSSSDIAGNFLSKNNASIEPAGVSRKIGKSVVPLGRSVKALGEK